jgi:hypothetical protein
MADVMLMRGVPEHIDGEGRTLLADEGWSKDAVHRTRQPLGERLLRVLQRKTTRWTAQRRDLLQPKGSADCHRAMAQALQHGQAALFARISTAGATDDEPIRAPAR